MEQAASMRGAEAAELDAAGDGMTDLPSLVVFSGGTAFNSVAGDFLLRVAV